MKAFQPYLNFDGKTREAMTFYNDAFGGTMQMQTYTDAKVPAPPGNENRVIHARIEVGSAILMASDSMPGQGVTFGNNAHINIDCDSKDEVDRLMSALGAGGKITMPGQDTFWGAYFGMLTDKFGVHWMFNAEKK